MDVREYCCVEDAKKAERAAERKAMKAARAKAEKALLKAINKSGLSAEDVLAKLGICCRCVLLKMWRKSSSRGRIEIKKDISMFANEDIQ